MLKNLIFNFEYNINERNLIFNFILKIILTPYI